MHLAHNSHLAYCTNIHRGGDWPETLDSLDRFTLAVRDQACPEDEYAIGLRLGASAARELSDPKTLLAFQKWLEKNNCYVFTINGFPYGNFHGARVKDQVYRPDWTTRERLDYTKLLFEVLCKILPDGLEGSVSTLPGSFKRFIDSDNQRAAINNNLIECAEYIDRLSELTGHTLHLGLEPEPLGYFETSQESVTFFDQLIERAPDKEELILRRLGINYDTCHLAVEYESAEESLARLVEWGILISKIHISSAVKVTDFSEATLALLDGFCEEVYLHQVVAQSRGKPLNRYEDLDVALEARRSCKDTSEEWRIHFHIPVHAHPEPPIYPTNDHILGTLDFLQEFPGSCRHFEMETYTWEVLPEHIGNTDVVDQLVKEYQWTLREFELRGLC
ncbi:MAG: hypothetical protein CMI18_07695 [Opitutaceae bacterium]|nr:hypothetical protein [Opitutaceae bacterium]|tara:strand:+ start:9168 stop:10340 length:1173 start_codon:yes stop_codon:yes gene_type:complete